MLPFLIEGARVVPIKPLLVYSIDCDLSKDYDAEENGVYRLRIDYYDHEESDSVEFTFNDYSNIFVIEK